MKTIVIPSSIKPAHFGAAANPASNNESASTGKGAPDAVRQRKSRQALEAAGGRRVTVNLTKEAAAALDRAMAERGLTATQTICAALQRYAIGL